MTSIRCLGLILAIALAACDGDDRRVAPDLAAVGEWTGLPERPLEGASGAFWGTWGDARGELAGYAVRVPRYGEVREGEVVHVTVVEPLDRRTWVKDEALPEDRRVYVVKLVRSVKFQTGVYPYSLETCVYSPVDRWPGERFDPVKVTFSAQEWCGHVFHALWPGREGALELLVSYFAEAGQRFAPAPALAGALYEDALWIQLRELDGPFAEGGPWKGPIVPSLWSHRTSHGPARAVEASISREAVEGGTRFTIRYEDVVRTIDVESGPERRILGWTGPGGESGRLLGSARLAYWELHRAGDEARRREFGLVPESR